MACNCIVLSSKLQSVENINGDSDYLLDYEQFEVKAVEILSSLTIEKINIEKKRIFSKRNELLDAYESINVAKEFLSEIN